MRRFEFVEGSSSKFWSGFVEGTTFTVLYGRIGTAGQRKDKAFPSEDAARRELEKKIAEKLREGYKEVAEGGAPPPPAAEPDAGERRKPKEPQVAPLPPRFQPRPATPERLAAAAAALGALAARLDDRRGRSWRIAQAARKARRALAAIAGAKVTGPLAAPFDALMARVVSERAPRLPLAVALDLLGQLDAAALDRALGLWARAADPRLALLRSLGDAELSLRLGRLLCERPAPTSAGFERRWQTLRPHVAGRLDLEAAAAGADPALRRALERLRATSA